MNVIVFSKLFFCCHLSSQKVVPKRQNSNCTSFRKKRGVGGRPGVLLRTAVADAALCSCLSRLGVRRSRRPLQERAEARKQRWLRLVPSCAPGGVLLSLDLEAETVFGTSLRDEAAERARGD